MSTKVTNSVKVRLSDPDALKKIEDQIQTEGYCVVTDVYSYDQCDDMRSDFWDLARQVRPEWMDDTGEYHHNFREFLGARKGMIRSSAMSHQQYVWDIRQNEQIVNIYRHLYGCDKSEDLYVSMDAICVRQPNTALPSELGESYHLDQTVNSKLCCIQGFVTLQDMNVDESPLRVWPGSHKLEIAKVLHKIGHADNFARISTESEADIARHYPEFEIKRFYVDAPAGSLVLWDSRLVHMGGRSAEEKLGRHVIYLSYQPKSMLGEWASSSLNPSLKEKKRARTICLNLRKEVFKNLCTTTHWASSRIAVSSGLGDDASIGEHEKQFLKDPLKFIPQPQLTSLGRSLVGLDDDIEQHQYLSVFNVLLCIVVLVSAVILSSCL